MSAPNRRIGDAPPGSAGGPYGFGQTGSGSGLVQALRKLNTTGLAERLGFLSGVSTQHERGMMVA